MTNVLENLLQKNVLKDPREILRERLEQEQQEKKEKDRKEMLLSMGFMEEYWDLTLDNFDLDQVEENFIPEYFKLNLAETINFARNYCNKFEEMKKEGIGIFLTGKKGRAKSSVANAIMRKLEEKGYSVLLCSVNGLQNTFVEGWHNEEAKQKFSLKMKNIDVLFIDDLGKEFCNRLTRAVVDEIVRYRALRKLPIIFTSNLKLDELSMYNGLDSLILGTCCLVELLGEDYRLKKQRIIFTKTNELNYLTGE